MTISVSKISRGRNKETQLDNKPAQGDDLMSKLYNVKRNVKYNMRAKNDAAIKKIQEKFSDYKKENAVNKEMQAFDIYVKRKETEDQKEEERRKNVLRQKESETKKILDYQIRERETGTYLEKYMAAGEAKTVTLDVADWNVTES